MEASALWREFLATNLSIDLLRRSLSPFRPRPFLEASFLKGRQPRLDALRGGARFRRGRARWREAECVRTARHGTVASQHRCLPSVQPVRTTRGEWCRDAIGRCRRSGDSRVSASGRRRQRTFRPSAGLGFGKSGDASRDPRSLGSGRENRAFVSAAFWLDLKRVLRRALSEEVSFLRRAARKVCASLRADSTSAARVADLSASLRRRNLDSRAALQAFCKHCCSSAPRSAVSRFCRRKEDTLPTAAGSDSRRGFILIGNKLGEYERRRHFSAKSPRVPSAPRVASRISAELSERRLRSASGWPLSRGAQLALAASACSRAALLRSFPLHAPVFNDLAVSRFDSPRSLRAFWSRETRRHRKGEASAAESGQVGAPIVERNAVNYFVSVVGQRVVNTRTDNVCAHAP